jgi:hypothetical protein
MMMPEIMGLTMKHKDTIMTRAKAKAWRKRYFFKKEVNHFIAFITGSVIQLMEYSFIFYRRAGQKATEIFYFWGRCDIMEAECRRVDTAYISMSGPLALREQRCVM